MVNIGTFHRYQFNNPIILYFPLSLLLLATKMFIEYLYNFNQSLSFLIVIMLLHQCKHITGFPKSKLHVFTVSNKYLKYNKDSLNLVIILIKP